MIKGFLRIVLSELLKILGSRAFKIVGILIIVFQGFLAYVSAAQTLSIGLDATPETCPYLLEPMPALEYMGFDVIMFSTIPMIVLGAICGAAEFRLHSLRTSLLTVGNRKALFFSKTAAAALCSLVLAFFSVTLCISLTHMAFGNEGLTPFVLSSEVWRFIVLAAAAIAMVTVLSYLIGFLCRSAAVPMLFLVAQAYNLGDILAERFYIFRFLPIPLANRLIAVSENAFAASPIENILLLGAWILALGTASFIMLLKIDLRGKY